MSATSYRWPTHARIDPLAYVFGIPSRPKNGGTSFYTFLPGVAAVINGVKYQLQPM